MKPQLEPLAVGIETTTHGVAQPDKFAILERAKMRALARAMPDAQSAVLLCLAWHAALQERMHRGALAGRSVARVSASTMAKITARPLRTVRYALSKLRSAGMIEREGMNPGRTSVYRLQLEAAGHNACERDIEQHDDVANATPD